MPVTIRHALAGLAVLAALPSTAAAQDTEAAAQTGEAANPFAIFTPTDTPIRHRIDYGIWDYALKNIVISMGPSSRSRPYAQPEPLGTRLRQGHNSRYRLEGSMVTFSSFENETIESFAEYRRDLESVGDKLDISTLPRDEQLAYWINLHNVAMMEKIAAEWPVRQPREIEVDGVPLQEAKFITVRGVAMSPRDIREQIVFANWRDPKVIYGFWRGEIGGPALEREAFTGANVGSLLGIAAEDFVNSLRGTQKSGDRLNVSKLYDEAAPFYFPDFQTDLRAHLAEYALEEVTGILSETSEIRASIEEQDIADLAGGSRGANYLASSRPGLPPGAVQLLVQRQRKLEVLEQNDVPTGRVIFSNIDLPGDPPNKNAVE
ncbi:MAG: DUF547 domain-containing protein [Erythrobacteraceae bacterium]|nr:DUF547 domain-containing protein [Erythrobacteraceae bacterium]